MNHKPLALTTAALVAGFLAFGSAQAANVMSGGGAMVGVEKSQNTNIEKASHRKGFRRWRGNRHWRNNRHWGGKGIYLGFGLLPFYQPYYQPYYAQSYYAPARGSRHVRYCLNRFQSYHIPSNTFLGYDGDRHRCRSPYRY